MPKKYIGFIVFLSFLVLLSLIIKVSRYEQLIYINLNPVLFKNSTYLSVDLRYPLPVISVGTPGVYDEETQLDYGGAAYDHWYKYLSSSDAETDKYWENWDWQDKVIQLHTTMVSVPDSIASFNIIRPALVGSKDNLRDVKVTCSPNETFILNKKNLGIVNSNVNPLPYMSVGSILYTYCNDSLCESVGNNFCAIIPNE